MIPQSRDTAVFKTDYTKYAIKLNFLSNLFFKDEISFLHIHVEGFYKYYSFFLHYIHSIAILMLYHTTSLLDNWTASSAGCSG